jgi:outer membrane protein assembly factor BamB
LDATTGQPIWSYNSPSLLDQLSQPAIGHDGTVFFIESTFPDQNRNNSASLVALNGSTGMPLFRVPLPSGSSEVFDSQGNSTVQTFSPDWFGDPMIDSNGTFSMAFLVQNQVTTTDSNGHRHTQQSSTVTLFQVTPDGTPSVIPIHTSNVLLGAFTWGVIPDGQGGVLVAWDDWSLEPALAYVTRIGPSGQSDYAFPSLFGLGGIYPMVLGDNATAYLTDGRTLQAFDVNSGQPRWTYGVPDSDYILPAVAAAGGGLVVTDFNFDQSLETVIRLDPAGNPTRDPWSAQVPCCTQIDYFIGDLWISPSSGNAITAYSAARADFAASSWPSPPQNNAEKRKINVQVFQLDPTQSGVLPITVDMTERVNSAINFWQNQGILLNWDRSKGVNGIQISPLCVIPPCLTGDVDNFTGIPSASANFIYSQAQYFLRQFSDPKSIYFVFINFVGGDETSAGTLGLPDPAHQGQFTGPSNIVAAGRSIPDVLPHETGHIFNLPHVRSSGNLMCGPLNNNWFLDLWPQMTCSSWWSNSLDSGQLTIARKKAQQYLQ